MDRSNLDNLRRMAPPEAHKRLRLFMEYARNFDDDEVPDPYYGLGHGFDLVLDMIEDGAQGLVDELRQRFGRT
jgi:protein-tyrosine phosphatase